MSLTDERCSGQQWVELSAFQNNAVTVLRVVRYSAKLIETVFNIILFDRFKINFYIISNNQSRTHLHIMFAAKNCCVLMSIVFANRLTVYRYCSSSVLRLNI